VALPWARRIRSLRELLRRKVGQDEIIVLRGAHERRREDGVIGDLEGLHAEPGRRQASTLFSNERAFLARRSTRRRRMRKSKAPFGPSGLLDRIEIRSLKRGIVAGHSFF
jgi:hypothetical protein